MGTAGAQRSMERWAWRLVVLVFSGAIILVLAQHPLLKWRERDSVKVQKQREWICRTVARLRKAEPPAADLAQSSSETPWITSGYLIFSNGWAAYKVHTHHDDRLIGDIALLRLADGRIYSSRHHYCSSIRRLMTRVDGNPPQPHDFEDFFNNRARHQEWNLLSPDGRLMCAVMDPRSRKVEKAIWVSIGDCDDSSATNFFVGRYTFSGDFLGWSTHWKSSDELAVDVFTYARNPFMDSDNARVNPTNCLSTLEFHRDKQTGRFTEVKP